MKFSCSLLLAYLVSHAFAYRYEDSLISSEISSQEGSSLQDASQLDGGNSWMFDEDDEVIDIDRLEEFEMDEEKMDQCRRRHHHDSSSSSDHHHHGHGRHRHHGNRHHNRPCSTTRCIRPTSTCCRRTTTDRVTTYILRRTTTTSLITTSLTKSTTITNVSVSTTSAVVSVTQTVTSNNSFTLTVTSSRTTTLPNTTITLSRTSTTTLPNKTIVSIVTQQIMPCFTEFETCFYNCPYYEIEPECGGCCRPKPTSGCGCHRPIEPICPCGPVRPTPCGYEMNLAVANGYQPCHQPCEQPNRVYVLPMATSMCNLQPTYEPIPQCGCVNPAPVTTITVQPAQVLPCLPPVTVTLQPNVFCTTEIVCAYYTPLVAAA